MPISPKDDHRFDDKATAETKGLAFAKAVGADHLADLRKLSVADLQKQTWDSHAYVDGYLLRSDLTTIYRNHRENDVPLLVGWTAEEGKDLVGFYLDPVQSTASQRANQMAKLLGYPPSDKLLTAYPGTTDAEAAASLNQLTNDWWGWRMVYWASLQVKYGHSQSYVYYFAHRPSAPPTPCYWGCGAGHGVEVQYMLDNLDVDPRSWSPDDRRLAARMADTVIQFARTGRPSGSGLPEWRRFDGSITSIHTIGNAAELKAHPIPDFSVFSQLARERSPQASRSRSHANAPMREGRLHGSKAKQ
jgi:para-nitrobenzyl esterase